MSALKILIVFHGYPNHPEVLWESLLDNNIAVVTCDFNEVALHNLMICGNTSLCGWKRLPEVHSIKMPFDDGLRINTETLFLKLRLDEFLRLCVG